MLSYEKISEGIYLNGVVRTADGSEVVKITDNVFRVTPNSGYYAERPDQHTLVVITPDDRKALYVRYMNRSAIKIIGIFNNPGGARVIAEEGGVSRGDELLSAFTLEADNAEGFFNFE